MKRLLIIVTLAILCVTSVTYAIDPGFLGMMKKASAAATGCAAYSSYKFCWDGDHASGTTYAYTSGAAINGTLDSAGGAINATGGYLSNGFRKIDNDQYLCFTITSDDIFDDAEGTLWMRARVASDRGTAIGVWEATANATPTQDDVHGNVGTTANNRSSLYYEGNSTEQYHNDTDVVIVGDAWVVLGLTWKQSLTEGAQLCVSDNGGEGWKCSADKDLTLPDPATNEFCIGERRVGGGETAGVSGWLADIDEVIIYATYKTAAPY